jgi:hypothetical protein
MRKLLMMLVAMTFLFAIAFPVLSGGGKEEVGVTATEDDWVPYYKRPDFVAYVDLPV